MKYTLFFACLFFMSSIAMGQAVEPANPGWLTNMNDAYAMSQKTGKPILANFTGSDWCGWCKKLTATVFSQDEFKKWAEKNVVLLELDFPRTKSLPEHLRIQNDNMRDALAVRGYPSVFLLDLKLNDQTKQYEIFNYGRTGYKSTVEEFTTDVAAMLEKKMAGSTGTN